MSLELLVIAAFTAGWVWLHATNDVSRDAGRQRMRVRVVR